MEVERSEWLYPCFADGSAYFDLPILTLLPCVGASISPLEVIRKGNTFLKKERSLCLSETEHLGTLFGFEEITECHEN